MTKEGKYFQKRKHYSIISKVFSSNIKASTVECGKIYSMRTHKVLLIWIFRVEKVDETTHKALLLSKVLRVRIISWLVWLVLDQRGCQSQNGIHLKTSERER